MLIGDVVIEKYFKRMLLCERKKKQKERKRKGNGSWGKAPRIETKVRIVAPPIRIGCLEWYFSKFERQIQREKHKKEGRETQSRGRPEEAAKRKQCRCCGFGEV